MLKTIVNVEYIYIYIYIFQNYFSCCSIADYADVTPQGYSQKDRVSIKTKGGNQLVDYNQ